MQRGFYYDEEREPTLVALVKVPFVALLVGKKELLACWLFGGKVLLNKGSMVDDFVCGCCSIVRYRCMRKGRWQLAVFVEMIKIHQRVITHKHTPLAPLIKAHSGN